MLLLLFCLLVLVPLALVASLRIHRFLLSPSSTIPTVGGWSYKERLIALRQYGSDPINFLRQCQKKYGDCFTVDLFIFKFTFFTNPSAQESLLKAKEEDASFFRYVPVIMGPKIQRVVDMPNHWFPAAFRAMRSSLLGPGRLDGYEASMGYLFPGFFDRWATVPDGVNLFDSTARLIHIACFYVLYGQQFTDTNLLVLLKCAEDFENGPLDIRIRFVPLFLWDYLEGGRKLNGSVQTLQALLTTEADSIYSDPEKHSQRTDYLYYLCKHTDSRSSIPAFAGLFLVTTLAFVANLTPTICWTILHADHLKLRESQAYREAAFKETARMYSFLASMRLTSTKKSVCVHGHILRPGTLIAASPLLNGHNEGFYKDPEKYDPTRFLQTDGNDRPSYERWIREGKFFQFGVGTHVCPGERLAKLIATELFLKNLVEGYDISWNNKGGQGGFDNVGVWPDWTSRNFGTPWELADGEPVKIILKRRKS